MLIHYWCPYLTNIATISSVKRSATYLKKFDKNNKINIEIINSYGEWSNTSLLKDKIIINNPLTLVNLFNLLPKKKIFSKLSLFIIFILSFFPLLLKLNKEKPDFLIIHLLTSLPIILSLFLNKKTKIILRISGLPRLNIFRKTLWKLFNSRIHLITTPTKITKNDLIKEKIFNEEKIHLLRDPVIEVNNINTLKKEKFENILLKKNDFYLSIGRFTKQKNFDFLVKEFSEVVDKLKIKKLCIIGDGEQRDYLKKIIHKHKMQDNIILLNYQLNPYKFIYNCKAIISVSLYEDPGFVLIESFYLNKVIISSDSKNGPKEMSLENDIGYFFKTNNSEDFKNKLIESEKNNNFEKIVRAKYYSKKFSTFSHYNEIIKLFK